MLPLTLSSPYVLPECLGLLASLTRLTIGEPATDTLRLLPVSLTRLRQLQVFTVESESYAMPSPASVLRLELLAELPALRAVRMAGACVEDLDWVQARTWRHAGVGMPRSATHCSCHARPACLRAAASRQQCSGRGAVCVSVVQGLNQVTCLQLGPCLRAHFMPPPPGGGPDNIDGSLHFSVDELNAALQPLTQVC